MATQTMTVTRALTALKNLDKRISDAIVAIRPYGMRQGDKFGGGFTSEEELKEELQKTTEKPFGLINYRHNLKRALVLSNAQTQVQIGGRTMTVAEAIEMKAAIEHEKNLLKFLRQNQARARQQYDHQLEAARERAEQSAQAVLGSDSENKGEEYSDFIKKFMENNGPVLVSYTDMEKKIEALAERIQNFEEEVDFVLSESNAKTTIDVDDAA